MNHRAALLFLSVMLTFGRPLLAAEPPAPSPVPAAAAPAASEADAAWANRDSKESLVKALELSEKALAGADGAAKLGVYERLIRGNYYLADFHNRGAAEVQKAIYSKAYKIGLECLAVKKGGDVEDTANALGKEYVPCIYWMAVSLAKFSKIEGMATKLKNKGKIGALIKRVDALAPGYFYGGTDRFWGGYYAALPWPVKNMSKSKEYYEKTMKAFPKYIGTWVVAAEAYAIENGEKDTYVKWLNEAVKMDPNADPEVAPECRMDQAKAKAMLAETDKVF